MKGEKTKQKETSSKCCLVPTTLTRRLHLLCPIIRQRGAICADCGIIHTPIHVFFGSGFVFHIYSRNMIYDAGASPCQYQFHPVTHIKS